MYLATQIAKYSININNMDKITESLQRALRAKRRKYNTLYNSLGKDGMSDMTSTSLHLTAVSDKHRPMSVVIDIDPSTSQFYIAAYPFAAYPKTGKNEVERFVSKWNNTESPASVIFDEDMGIPMPDTYCFSVHTSGVAPEKGLDTKTWAKYIKLIRENASDVWDMIDEIYAERNEDV